MYKLVNFWNLARKLGEKAKQLDFSLNLHEIMGKLLKNSIYFVINNVEKSDNGSQRGKTFRKRVEFGGTGTVFTVACFDLMFA